MAVICPNDISPTILAVTVIVPIDCENIDAMIPTIPKRSMCIVVPATPLARVLDSQGLPHLGNGLALLLCWGSARLRLLNLVEINVCLIPEPEITPCGLCYVCRFEL